MSPPSLGNSCPIPLGDYPNILLAHGGGGKLMQQLLEKMFLTAFQNGSLEGQHDSAVLDLHSNRIALTTDSFVVKPRFFPGGNIGSLAVYGTVNDLAMAGARPLYLSVGFILEEGLPMEELWQVVLSMKEAALRAGVQIVTGDTKVVERGKGDGIYVNTTGVGMLPPELEIHPRQICEGDAIILSGDLGRHGMAIMAVREGLEFESEIESDSAPLNSLVSALLEANFKIHCMRDLTRGGLGSVLWELAESSRCQFEIDEKSLPVSEPVRGACEILGLDPLFVANEGRCVIFLPDAQAPQVLDHLRQHPLGQGATRIGTVASKLNPQVVIHSLLGVPRIVEKISGEQLPRIC